MVRLISAFVLATALLSGIASAQGQSDFGLGMIIGEPTGLSGKLWTGPGSAVDGAAAWTLNGDDSFHMHVDYLLHNYSLINTEKGRMPLYYGIGGRVRLDDRRGNDAIGIRIPIGLEYLFQDAPMDIFMELAPVLDLAPDTQFDLTAALGTRYFF